MIYGYIYIYTCSGRGDRKVRYHFCNGRRQGSLSLSLSLSLRLPLPLPSTRKTVVYQIWINLGWLSLLPPRGPISRVSFSLPSPEVGTICSHFGVPIRAQPGPWPLALLRTVPLLSTLLSTKIDYKTALNGHVQFTGRHMANHDRHQAPNS